MRHTQGARNTFLGSESGGNTSPSEKDGENNSYIGYRSGYNTWHGDDNVFLGAYSGFSLTNGSGNVFIGYNSGYNETGSNKLYIDNSNTTTPLIYGDFSTNQVGINALPDAYTLNVGGQINATGIFVNGTAVSLGTTTVSPWTLNGTAVNYNNGNVGIGILSNIPNYKLDVNGVINATGYLVNGVALSTSQWTTSGTTIYYSGGNVGIGTTSTGSFKLAVEGKVGVREIQVTAASPWPDYVFEQDHKLSSLEEIDEYIKANKHLPDVPSAEEVKKDGHQLGEMDIILLKKLEEMTLYVIEQEKKIKKLEEQLDSISKRNNKK